MQNKPHQREKNMSESLKKKKKALEKKKLWRKVIKS